jgi:methyl-accepting chemotaxis protein WspA
MTMIRKNKGLSIELQLLLAFLALGVNIVLVSLMGWWVSQRLVNRLQATEALWKINEGQTQIQSSERSMLTPFWTLEQRAKEQTRIKNAWTQINSGFSLYKTISSNSDPRRLGLSSEEQKQYADFIQAWDEWVTNHEEFLRLEGQYEALGIDLSRKTTLELSSEVNRLGSGQTIDTSGQAAAAYNKLNEMSIQTVTKKAPAFQKATEALLALLSTNESYADQLVATSRWVLLLTMFLCTALATFLALYFVRTIARPLTRLLQKVQESGLQVTGSVSQIAASGRQLEATLNEQAASTTEVLATAKQISSTSQELAKTVEGVTHLARDTAKSAEQSRTEMVAIEDTMMQLTKSTETIAAKLGNISDRASRINTIVTTITQVADQTNLLSLNASIEAEKASEYGRGFAVVAREIRRLADQTAVATLDIETIVREMQSSVATGVMEVDKFAAQVGQSAQAINTMGRQLTVMIEKVTSLTPQFVIVDQGMTNQATAAVQISEAMLQLSDTTSLNADALQDVNESLRSLEVTAQSLEREANQIQI